MERILDHGYLRLIDVWGSDQRIVESARMSTQKGFLGWGPKGRCTVCGWETPVYQGTKCKGPQHADMNMYTVIQVPGDEKLLRYMWEHKHGTPFEMAGLTFEVKAPIMVYRQWHRHRVPHGYNEQSARYGPLPDENYIPEMPRLFLGGGRNKQAGKATDAELTKTRAQLWLDRLEHAYELCEDVYQEGLMIGIPKEVARVIVPVGRYSTMRATSNLRGWLAFLGERCASDAQWEIRQYALAIAAELKRQFPRTYEVACGSLEL